MENCKKLIISLCTFLLIISASGQEKQNDKLQDAIQVLNDFSKMKEKIPQQLLQNIEGIIVIPKLINAGLVVGGKRGRGIAIVKTGDNSWSDPVFVTLTGGSFGFQIGVQSIDLVLVFRHRTTLENIEKTTFTLGGDASVAAGPVGRNSTANTDFKLEAEIYSYSKSRGLFAGISLNGAALGIDDKANHSFYNESATAQSIFSNSNSTDADVITLKQTLKNLQ